MEIIIHPHITRIEPRGPGIGQRFVCPRSRRVLDVQCRGIRRRDQRVRGSKGWTLDRVGSKRRGRTTSSSSAIGKGRRRPVLNLSGRGGSPRLRARRKVPGNRRRGIKGGHARRIDNETVAVEIGVFRGRRPEIDRVIDNLVEVRHEVGPGGHLTVIRRIRECNRHLIL